MTSPLILPSSMTRESRGAVMRDGHAIEPIFCASCHRPGGESERAPGNFVFWLCRSCYETHGSLIGGGVTPHAPFRERVAAETTHTNGRPFSPAEILEALRNPNSTLSMLAREAPGA